MVLRKASKKNTNSIKINNSSKEKQTTNVKESFEERERARRQKRIDAENAKKQKELEEKKEKERKEKIVMEYMANLKKQINEKDSWSFFVFPDRAGFKKIKLGTVNQMQKLIDKDNNPEKYKNRRLVLIKMISLHDNTRPESFRVKFGIMFKVSMSVMLINDKAKISDLNKDWWGCDIAWYIEDFETTKFTFKLLERIMPFIASRRKTCTSLTGYPITALIKDLKKMGGDFSDVLNPLAGL